ncbi:hypothetical protein [Niveibacterium sp. SC-1]|uniref:DUF7079 family protein n=1 Tax=Niveibacterium sp. SC-1 TaxID=3135646 RepID=UPI00311DC5C9
MSESSRDLARQAAWVALAELFVARELQAYDYRAIADALLRARLPVDELRQILRTEVGPAFIANLSPLNSVPSFEGWHREYVLERVAATRSSASALWGRMRLLASPNPLKNRIVAARWKEVEALLSAGSASGA